MKTDMKSLKSKIDEMPLRRKIFLYLTGFCGIMVGLMWLMQVVFLPGIYEAIRLRQINTFSREIESVLGEENRDEKIETIADENDVCVMLVSSNGQILYSAEALQNCMIHKISYISILDIIFSTDENGGRLYGIYSKKVPFKTDEMGSTVEYKFDPDDEQSMIYCKKVDLSNTQTGYLLLNIKLTPVYSTVFTIKYTLVIITVVMILFAVILAVIISRRISTPISRINRGAKQLATGDYDVNFTAHGYKEINQLAETLTVTSRELGKVESLRREFIANVSHDLRTPLTLIGGYAEVMRDIPGENNSENAQVIIDETKRLSSLVNDVLDMSKIQSGAIPMEKKPYDLSRSVRSVADRLSELLKREGYTFELDLRQKVTVNADETRINQCIYNLLINAVNYTGKDKKVYVSLTQKDGAATLQVTDTGEGVAEKDLPYIWERYYKNDKNHIRSVVGTGIGLSIVRSVIKAHGGKYGVFNSRDKGACFWFELPVK